MNAKTLLSYGLIVVPICGAIPQNPLVAKRYEEPEIHNEVSGAPPMTGKLTITAYVSTGPAMAYAPVWLTPQRYWNKP